MRPRQGYLGLWLTLLVAAGCGVKSSSEIPTPAASEGTSDTSAAAAADPAVPAEAAPSGETPTATETASHDEAEATEVDEAEVAANLAKLSEEDRKAAETQRDCPVSGHRLGGMGPPEKVDVDGRAVYICCSGCEKELKANAEKYLAALDKKPAEAPSESP